MKNRLFNEYIKCDKHIIKNALHNEYKSCRKKLSTLMNNNNNSNNIYFNGITLADWVKQFLFKFTVDISFDRMPLLFSSHII